MPFGSICNAYGQVFVGKIKDMKEFINDMTAIYCASQTFIAKSLEEKPVEPAEIKKVKEFLSKIPNKSPAQYNAEADADDNLNNA
jgi:hypothetical protein